MVFSNPLSFSFAIPNVNEKHKHKIIVINRSYTIINLTYQYHEEDQFFERNARCSNFIYC